MTDIPRDQWGRPRVIPPGGGPLVSYTRVSTLAKALDEGSNLTLWKQRVTAIGILRRAGLQTRLAGVLASGDPDGPDAKREINAIVKEAFEAAGGSDKASAGTGFHALSEAIDAGRAVDFIPDADRPRLDAYRDAMRGYTPVAAEQFVVCDELRAGGSYDRLWMCPDSRVRVGDLKSGKWDKEYPTGVTTQMAIYARSKLYDPETGTRTPLHDLLDTTTGLLITMPPSGGCEVVPLNLERGWYLAQLAAEVRAARSWKARDFYATLPPAQDWDVVLAEAARTFDLDGLRDLWKRAGVGAAPTDIRTAFEAVVNGLVFALSDPDMARFLSHVNKSGPIPQRAPELGPCWLWTIAVNKKGYGRFGIGAHKSVAAHRWLYEKLVGLIPGRLTLDHLCRVPQCVNPAHMEVVTRAENNRRAAADRRIERLAKAA